MKNKNLTETWKQYQQIKSYLQNQGYFEELQKSYDFFMGNQWKGLESGNQTMPVDNIIAPICNYKVGKVSQHNMGIVFSTENMSKEDLMEVEGVDLSKRKVFENAVELLNKSISKFLETNNMESKAWDYLEENCISGTVCAYIYKDEEDTERIEMIYANNIFFADENEEEIQKQPFIIITFRRNIDEVKAKAKENGLQQNEIDLIKSDDSTEELVGNRDEIDNDKGKCLCVIKLYKKEIEIPRTEIQTVILEDGTSIQEQVKLEPEKKTVVFMTESTKQVEYIKETNLGLTLYPIAKMVWKRDKNNARGKGEPVDKINNQIEINKTLARRSIAIQMSAYPKLAYLKTAISNPNSLNKVGVAIEVDGQTVTTIRDALEYLRPAQISNDAKIFNDELAQKTRENAAASDTALGNINPEQASGRAILAMRDASSIPLNVHVSRFVQFYEDFGSIYFDFKQNVDVEGFNVLVEEVDEITGEIITRLEIVPYKIMQELKVSKKVSAIQIDPYSIYASEQGLDNMFAAGAIDLEERVLAMSDHSNLNKNKLEEIIQRRKEKEKEFNTIQNQISESQSRIQNTGASQELLNTLMQNNLTGGQMNEMSSM